VTAGSGITLTTNSPNSANERLTITSTGGGIAVAQGTNIVLVTNGSTVTIHGTGSGGSGTVPDGIITNNFKSNVYLDQNLFLTNADSGSLEAIGISINNGEFLMDATGFLFGTNINTRTTMQSTGSVTTSFLTVRSNLTVVGGIPTNAMSQAAHEFYAGGGDDTVVTLEQFGGVADGKVLRLLSVASGVVSAPQAEFTAADVGKTILIYKDTTNLALPHYSTISAFNNSTNVTIATNITITGVMDGIYGTDNCPAWTNLVATVSGSINLQLRSGIYLFAQRTLSSGVNTVLDMPASTQFGFTNLTRSLLLKGLVPAPQTSWIYTNGAHETGTILFDAAAPVDGQTNSFLNHFLGSGLFGGFGLERIQFENITFRKPPGSKSITAWWRRGGMATFKNCTADKQVSRNFVAGNGDPLVFFDSIRETNIHNADVAFVGPEWNNGGSLRFETVGIQFHGTGIYAQEHTVVHNFNFTAGNVPIYMDAQGSGTCVINGNKWFIFASKTGPVVSTNPGPVYLSLDTLIFETHGLTASTNFFIDPANQVAGHIGLVSATGEYVRIVSGNKLSYYNAMEDGFKTYSPQHVYQSNVAVSVNGKLGSELGGNTWAAALLYDYPFTEGTGSNIWSRTPNQQRLFSVNGSPVWTNGYNGFGVLLPTNAARGFVSEAQPPTAMSNMTVDVWFKASTTNRVDHMHESGSFQLTSGYNGTNVLFGSTYYAQGPVPSGGHDGNWHKLTGVYQNSAGGSLNSSIVSVFFDGVLVKKYTNSIGIVTAGPFINGSGVGTGAPTLSRWRMWTRALTDEEVLTQAKTEGFAADAAATSFSTNQAVMTITNLTVGSVTGDGSGLTNIQASATYQYVYCGTNTPVVTNSASYVASPVAVTLSTGIWKVSFSGIFLGSSAGTNANGRVAFSGTATQLGGKVTQQTVADATQVYGTQSTAANQTGSTVAPLSYSGALGNSVWLTGEVLLDVTAQGSFSMSAKQVVATTNNFVSIGKYSYIVATKLQ
jgi:hypothetical protein